MLVTSIFSFSHNVFKSFFFRVVKSGLCGKNLNEDNLSLTLYHIIPTFNDPEKEAFLKTV